MQKGNYLDVLLRSNKTVLTLKDIALLWQDADTDAARVRLNYYVKKGDLYRIRRGLYAKSKDYSKLELATRIFTPSYVSFETVLAKEGLIFQYQTNISVASYLTRKIVIDDQAFTYKKLKEKVLLSREGIIHEAESSIANKERAFLDTLYVYADYHYDNLRSIDWGKAMALLPLYQNHRLAKKVNQLYRQSKIV